MKTALFIVLTDHPGGAEQVASMLANALSRRPGWTVEYRVLSAMAEPSFSRSRLSPAVVVTFGSGRSPLPGLLSLPFSFGRKRFDLVFTTHIHTNGLAALSRRLGLLRVVRLVTRESTTLFDRFKGPKRWLAQLLYATYGAQDLAISQTTYMQSHIAPRVPRAAVDRVAVLGNPLDLDAIERMADDDPPDPVARRLGNRVNLLVCGRLVEIKQPTLALDSFVLLSAQRSEPLQLVFMGDGPLRPQIEEDVRARGLTDRVVFLGRQANPYAIMRLCQYGLLTSSREGFPNVVLEMMACGLRKIVVTPCAGDLDTLPGVTVTEGFTAQELAAALAEAMTAREDRGKAYRAAVKDRSVDSYLDAVLGLEAPR